MSDLNGFYKVTNNSGLSLITALFYNPETKEVKSMITRDYDYSDCSRDNDDLYYMPVDIDVRKLWRLATNFIQIGDKVEVVKGRKVPIGTVGVVKKMWDWKDNYGRVQTTYISFEDGSKTSVYNCKLLSPDGVERV